MGGTRCGSFSKASDAGGHAEDYRVPVISSPRGDGMECFGRSLAGSIKGAATPPEAGAMTNNELAPGCVAGSHDRSSARQRM
jgi:hypothetical protein